MYACIEHEYQETIENIGGSSETIYTYSYTTGWTQNPQKAATFKGDNSEKPEDIPSNYDNWIDKMPKSTASQVSGFTINGVNVKGNLTFYGAKDLALSTNDVRNLGSNEYVAHNVIYRANNGSPNDIKVGDVRIRYRVIMASDNGLLIAKYSHNQFEPFLTKKAASIFHFFAGVHTKNEAVKILNEEYQQTPWLFRLTGFLMMFCGLMLITNPVTTLMSVIPLFAKIGHFAYGIIAILTSLIITGLTILISIFFNNIYLK